MSAQAQGLSFVLKESESLLSPSYERASQAEDSVAAFEAETDYASEDGERTLARR